MSFWIWWLEDEITSTLFDVWIYSSRLRFRSDATPLVGDMIFSDVTSSVIYLRILALGAYFLDTSTCCVYLVYTNAYAWHSSTVIHQTNIKWCAILIKLECIFVTNDATLSSSINLYAYIDSSNYRTRLSGDSDCCWYSTVDEGFIFGSDQKYCGWMGRGDQDWFLWSNCLYWTWVGWILIVRILVGIY